MSGFAGIVGPMCLPEERAWLEQATRYMAFRGPDAQDTWSDERVGLGHALLATSPEELGRTQPATLDGLVWIAADVRLDARAELVRALRARDRDASLGLPDFELVLHAYHVWGDRCLEHLAGDFAFAIWDRRAHRVFCGRDQVGVGQLYYAQVGEHLLFSNTLECLLLHPHVSDKLDEAAIGDFLVLGLNSDPSTTTFARIHRLPPAHFLSSSNGRVEIERYWKVPEASGYLRYSKAEDYVEHFRELVTETVADRIRTDRLSVQLSGGMDSTSIAVTARQVLAASGQPFQLQALTVVLDGLMEDREGDYARQVADSLGIEHQILSAGSYQMCDVLRADFLPPAPVPYLQTSLQYDVVRRAAQHSRVALTGHGGDCLLRFLPSYWIQWIATGQLGRLAAAGWHHLRLFHRLPRSYFRAAIKQARRREAAAVVPGWLDQSFALRTALDERVSIQSARLDRQIDATALAESPLWSELFGWFDPGFTRLPVRFRHPFFDLRLLGYVLALPPVPWFPQKRILRDAMCSRMPESVRLRRKTALAEDAGKAIERQRGLAPGLVELVATAPGLERFLDRDRLLSRLRAADQPTQSTYRDMANSLGLARWLYHWRRPTGPMPEQELRFGTQKARPAMAVQ